MPNAIALIGVTGIIYGLPEGIKRLAASVASNNAVGATADLAISGAGETVVAIPGGATGCLIVPSPTNATALELRSTSASPGLKISPSLPSLHCFASGDVSFILWAAAAATGSISVSFF